LIFLSIKWSTNYSTYVKKKSYLKMRIEYHVKYQSKVKLISEPKNVPASSVPNGSLKRGGAYYSPTTDTGQSDPVHGVAQIIEHFRTEFNRCQLRLNPFVNVIPPFTAICSFILFRLAVQYEFVLPRTNEI
jgi:hypothetical protein